MPTSHHGRIGPAQWPFIGLSSPAPTGRVARGMCGFPCASASPAGNIRFRRLGLGSPSRGVSSSPAVRKDHRATLTYESAARQPDSSRVLSSGGERFLDAEEVRGSNPLAPTRFGSRNILTFLAHQLQEQERSRARHRTPRHRLQHQPDDLRRLRLHGVIEKIPDTNTYQITSEGTRTAVSQPNSKTDSSAPSSAPPTNHPLPRAAQRPQPDRPGTHQLHSRGKTRHSRMRTCHRFWG